MCSVFFRKAERDLLVLETEAPTVIPQGDLSRGGAEQLSVSTLTNLNNNNNNCTSTFTLHIILTHSF